MTAVQPTPSRLVIYTQDILKIHECSPSSASRKLQAVKVYFDKRDHHLVTIKEYCEYFDLPYIETCEFLQLIKS